MLTGNTLRRLSLTFKVVTIAVALYAAMFSHYPPANAQSPPPVMPQPNEITMQPQQYAMSPYDPEFRAEIDGINRHLTSTDTRLKEEVTAENILNGEVREMQGSEKVYFWIITGLLTGSIVLPQLKERRGSKGSE